MEGVTVIAVDGPVAAGKGTLARHLATKTGLGHLDSGMIYRAVASRVRDAGDDASSAQACRRAAEHLLATDLQRPGLRDQEIGLMASRISAHREVRVALVEFQRRLGATPPGTVVDGRDIGTVVFPDADVKFFVTAHLRTRAARRHRELVERGESIDYSTVLTEIAERDRRDRERTWAPLRRADDAIVIDTTNLDAVAAVEEALDVIRQRLPCRVLLG